jgi:hypothetical protein
MTGRQPTPLPTRIPTREARAQRSLISVRPGRLDDGNDARRDPYLLTDNDYIQEPLTSTCHPGRNLDGPRAGSLNGILPSKGR